jgi:hypothetical protein
LFLNGGLEVEVAGGEKRIVTNPQDSRNDPLVNREVGVRRIKILGKKEITDKVPDCKKDKQDYD